MNTSEFDKREEFQRSSETGSFEERVMSEEFLNYKVKRIDELSGSAGASQAKAARKPKKNNGILVSALAALGSAAIITVAVVASILGVTVKSREAGYDYINYSITVNNDNGKALYGRLSNGGEVVQIQEMEAAEASVRFENLFLNMPYTFEVVDKEGKVYFSEEIKTRSPIKFYSRPDILDKLFFTADLEALYGSGIYHPTLRDAEGRSYELYVQTGWENEAEIDLNSLTAGKYTLAIFDTGTEVSFEVYSETVYIEGLRPAMLIYSENSIEVKISEKTIGQYDEIVMELTDGYGTTTRLTGNVIDFNSWETGNYSLTVFGIKNSEKKEIYSDYLSVPLL